LPHRGGSLRWKKESSVVWRARIIPARVVLHRFAAVLHIPAILPHVAALLYVAALLHAATIGIHLGMFAAFHSPLGGEARVDSLGAFKAFVAAASVVASVAESQRAGNR